jgi:DNA polymerase-3 subunit epsilon
MTGLRQVVLDTETTGLSASDGHRIVEIGCVELIERRQTGRVLHLYLNPEREIDEGALAVHGLSLDFLRDQPRFDQVVEQLTEFVADAEVLIHNAPFDLGFLDAEFARLSLQSFAGGVRTVTDTLALARSMHPGKRNSLDALCERYGVSNAHRSLHGALLDAQLLAEVYLAMTRGQDSLEIALGPAEPGGASRTGPARDWPPSGLLIIPADAAEQAAHQGFLEGIARDLRQPAIWTRLEIDDPAQTAASA